MKLPFIRGAFAILFWPEYAKRVSAEHHEFLNQASEIERREQEEPWAHQQISRLRRSWLSAFFIVVVVIGLGAAAGFLLSELVGDKYSTFQAALQYVGAGFLLWATLGQGGWHIQTMDGKTFAEMLDTWVYRVIHVVGTFSLVTGVVWSLS